MFDNVALDRLLKKNWEEMQLRHRLQSEREDKSWTKE